MKNPIVHEVPVMATGVRPGESGGQRRLFTEEASTVLAFENGGVIRLSAAVAVGQLLVLTNKGNKREVVAHVKRKRDCRPTSCYVEVEFSERSAGFWGIEFPEMPQLASANALQGEAAEFELEGETIADELVDEPRALARAPSARAQVTQLKQKVSASGRSGAPRIGLLSLALVLVAAGAAWYPHRLSWQPKKFSASAASSIAVHANPAVSSRAQKAVDAHSNSSTAILASAAAAPRPSVKSTPAGGAGRSTLAVPVAPAQADTLAHTAVVPEKSAVGASAAKRSMWRPSSEAASESAAPSLDEAPIVPPKLIKSVRAIAPPDALRDFVTGNVMLDAVVDPAGLVKSMKVLSGPASFHTAAMDALKQYRYQPATQRGKPVAAHITITIKFWFEP